MNLKKILVYRSSFDFLLTVYLAYETLTDLLSLTLLCGCMGSPTPHLSTQVRKYCCETRVKSLLNRSLLNSCFIKLTPPVSSKSIVFTRSIEQQSFKALFVLRRCFYKTDLRLGIGFLSLAEFSIALFFENKKKTE